MSIEQKNRNDILCIGEILTLASTDYITLYFAWGGTGVSDFVTWASLVMGTAMTPFGGLWQIGCTELRYPFLYLMD